MGREFTIGLIALLFAASLAGGTPSLAYGEGSSAEQRLAPAPQVLEADIDELEARLDEADASSRALARAHNAWAARLQVETKPACEEPAVLSLARTPALMALHTARVQAARAQLSRVEEGARAPTLQALSEGVLAPRLAVLGGRVSAHERAWTELIAWQRALVAPTLGKCKPALAVAPGLAPPMPVEPLEAVAVLGMGGGLVCPAGWRADGHAEVVDKGLACYSEATCDCTPVAVLPGAVLGPQPVEPPAAEVPPPEVEAPEAVTKDPTTSG